MAFALRRLLRSSKIFRDREKSEGRESPRQAARRLLARACNPCRDGGKVVPAEGGGSPVQRSTGADVIRTGSDVIINNTGKSSNKSSSRKKSVINENAMNHSQLVRTRRLMKEFQEVTRGQRTEAHPMFSVELVDDNLYEWNVKLFRIDPESLLYRDMVETNVRYVLLNITFPDNFPFAPPFMRVIAPRIEKGFVMEGGAICMELLTPRGWASAYTIEAVIMQFAASLVKGQGRIARKVKGAKDFSRKSAEASFRSLVKTHEKYGWVTPPLADG